MIVFQKISQLSRFLDHLLNSIFIPKLKNQDNLYHLILSVFTVFQGEGRPHFSLNSRIFDQFRKFLPMVCGHNHRWSLKRRTAERRFRKFCNKRAMTALGRSPEYHWNQIISKSVQRFSRRSRLKLFSIYSPGDHFVQHSGTVWAIFVDSHLRNIPV